MIMRGVIVAAITVIASGVIDRTPAEAQQPQPGTIAKQFEDKAKERARGKSAAPTLPDFSSQAANANKAPAFVLKGVSVNGATAIPREEIARVYRSLLGRPVSQADLLKISDGITALYRQKGYALSRAFIPAQDVKEGRVQIRVVEGHIDEVAFEGADGGLYGADQLLAAVKAERPLRLATLERGLLVVSDTPGIAIKDTMLKEVGQASGRFRLTLLLEAWRHSVSVEVDNRGTADIGPLQSFISGAAHSALIKGDVWALNVMTIPDTPEELAYLGGLAEFPLGRNGHRFGVKGYFSELRPDGIRRLFDTRINTTELGVYIGSKPIRTSERSLDLVLSAGLRHAEEKDTGGTLYDDRIQFVTFSADYQVNDHYNGTNYLVFGGRLGYGEPGSEWSDLSRFDAEGEFYKLFWTAARNQRITERWSLLLSTSGQWTSSSLLQSEQFYIGGPLLGRAFSSGELAGDSGVAGLLEIRFDSAEMMGPIRGYQLYGFIDAGIVWNNGSPIQESLSSYGAGIRVALQDEYRAGFEIALPLDYHSFANQDDGTRFYFSLSKTFRGCPLCGR